MTGIRYSTIEETLVHGGEARISYGIAAYSDTETDGTAVRIAVVRDICSSRQRIADLVRLCNGCQLSVIHLPEIVEDFLAL